MNRQTDQNFTIQAPRMDLSIFTGTDVLDWEETCEDYFEINQTPEIYKSRLATMNFCGDARQGYRSSKIDNPILPPWPILLEEVKERFKDEQLANPFGELRKIIKTGTVSDYIKEFENTKTRLITETR